MKLVHRKTTVSKGLAAMAVAMVLLAVDQVIKYFVLNYLRPIGTLPVIEGLFELNYVENTGVAFGLFRGHIWLISTFTILATLVVVVLVFRYQQHTFFSYATAACIVAGGLGNLFDRMILGFVVDYLHVLFFDYVFNFADCCITVGAVLFIIHVLFSGMGEKEGNKKLPSPPDAPDQTAV